ncbi:hypothetical protein OQY15_20710 [Pedobacter sp. MC2016-15]|uniref:M61 family metallopeptidase n=1 Tax=Pedobacter sp. MC2016-15 TaxID=2994473 RepID=UPI0022472716|nr:hypothetical protein [Pedobacter sp. MC2016-15]MCX2481534.1 hypothetical protein [Pedobacter sp. MC2016-15]
MKLIITIITLFLLSVNLQAQVQTDQYQYKIDLLNIENDKVSVSFTPPKNKLKSATFVMPKLVPGYYDAMNFGQHISELKAFDKTGKEIGVAKQDVNTWKIADLEHTVKISYQVEDGWEYLVQNTGGAKSPTSMFKKDSVSIINYNALVGYFQELPKTGYTVTIKKNPDFYASSALPFDHKNDTTDVATAVDYRRLVDAPVMYCKPDTTWLKVGDTKVLVSFYSAAPEKYSKVLADKISSILENQRAYLGGKLPVKDYAFLIYHESIPHNGLMGDGLEHSNSTVCLYGSKNLDRLPQALMRVASHEFFHVLTPLNVHSEEIQEFNFLNPVLSQHFWLYEGMTEYATLHMPVKQHMINLDEFVKSINEKIDGMKKFDDTLSMTLMSKQAIERQDQYMNIYQKGALIGLCLDIRLRELSNGKSGTQDLILALAKKYGPERAFKDDTLFDTITKMTHPEIREFFSKYVEKGNPLPLKESLQKAGLDYDETTATVTIAKSPSKKQVAFRKMWID